MTAEIDIKALIDMQRAEHNRNPFPSVQERASRIKRLIEMLAVNEGKICEALMADFGNRPEITTRMAEILGTISTLKYALENIENWVKPSLRHTPPPAGPAGATSEVQYMPLGSIGVISPWNLPINLSFGVMGAIFAAGNRVVLKPSEVTTHTSALIKEMVASYFNEAELAVVCGGEAVAAAFSESKFDHIMFTGSTSVGKKVAVAAAKNLVPCTLELGGKNSIIVSKSADTDEIAKKIMMIRMLNGGQVCLAPDVVFVPEEIEDKFIASCKQVANSFFPNMESDPDYGQIISDRHVLRLKGLLSEIEAQRSSEVVYLFDRSKVPLDRRFPPVIVKSPGDETELMKNEVFGPIMSVFPYSDFDSVLERLNTDENIRQPLAIYYFGSDEAEKEKVRYRTLSGGLCFNTLAAHYSVEDLPFGGVGRSGIGSYHGIEGFKTFSHAKAVYTQCEQDFLAPMLPPHSPQIKSHVADMVKGVLGS